MMSAAAHSLGLVPYVCSLLVSLGLYQPAFQYLLGRATDLRFSLLLSMCLHAQ